MIQENNEETSALLNLARAKAFLKLAREVRALVEDLSDGQILELADLLHDIIRERRGPSEARSFAPPA